MISSQQLHKDFSTGTSRK